MFYAGTVKVDDTTNVWRLLTVVCLPCHYREFRPLTVMNDQLSIINYPSFVSPVI